MRKVTDYILLLFKLEDIPTVVNKKLAEGWDLYGSPSQVNTLEGGAILQAMVKHSDKEEMA